MNRRQEEFVARRILVALDASAHGFAALQAAADLAGRLGAELMGVFVEDIDLLRCAALPFTREVGLGSGAVRSFDVAVLERRLRGQVAQLQRALEAAAGRVQVRWSFRSIRGQVVSELLSAAETADLLVMGRATQAAGSWIGHAMAARTPQRGSALGQPVVTVFYDAPAAERALAMAACLAQPDHQDLVVLVPAVTPEAAARLQARVESWLQARGLAARIRHLLGADEGGLMRAVRAVGARVLVLGSPNPVVPEQGLPAALGKMPCSLVLVR